MNLYPMRKLIADASKVKGCQQDDRERRRLCNSGLEVCVMHCHLRERPLAEALGLASIYGHEIIVE